MQVFNHFRFDNLRGDLFGGVTTAIVSLPLALTFGVASGAGPAAGLYGAILVGLFAALFGGTSTLISEPTGPMTVVMTAVIVAMLAQNPDQGMAMAFTVVMVAGLFQILFGLLKLGKYITLMPYSVISGFMSGIGIILMTLQLAPLMGQPSPPGGVLGTLQNLPTLVANIRPTETILGLLTLAILFLFPARFKRYVPPQLIALVAGTVVSLLVFANEDLRRIGVIPVGLPELIFPTFTPEQITTIMIDGLILGMLGCIDTTLTAMIADSLTRTEHRSDKELIGQGLGNFVSGLFGGLPGAGATMGTVVNIQSGGRTPLAGVIRALLLLVVVFGAARLTEQIPLAVLAGIAMHVGFNILDWSLLKRAHRVSFQTTVIMYGVLLLTVFVDLIVAVGVGIFIANILTIERLSALQSEHVKAISDADDAIQMTDEERSLLQQADGRVLLFYLSGPMIFGVSKAIARQHATISEYDAVVIDLSNVPLLDDTISLAIENAIKDAVEARGEVFIVSPTAAMHRQLSRLDIFAMIPEDHVFCHRPAALRRAVGRLMPALPGIAA
ncbi:SulP family inorganic anion transporter [Candidatus Chloroploca sp. M-50]|uniref:SulP family inorganic anion transporter n=1 Tax=Candidatus Chloroploca mongolica TaxID=2528176 RepID=A0ABS4DAT2_9CHLR|nr:SulP family inorganic anion transporter [Candidatus Chloroploca mongolica]MBP1466561.1 SulP family inorganic anion transporter [Candidatus Chloroploca mongolica]